MRFPRSYLRVDLTKLFCEDSDSSGHSEDGEEIARSTEWRPGKENGQNGYHPEKRENVDPWAKVLSQVKSQELRSIPYDTFVHDASSVENKSQVKPSSGGREKEKTYRIQTIGEVYALQKREGKELPTFRGIRENRSKNSGAKRSTLRRINEPLLMGTGYASYKSRSSARGKEWDGDRSNDPVDGYRDPGEDEAYAARFPDNDDPTQTEYALMRSPKDSAGPSAQPNSPDIRDLLHQQNQTTREHPHIYESHPGLLESDQEDPQAPPADVAAIHSQMCPFLYGGYGFPYEGPFYNPIVTPLFPYPTAPPYPIGPIFPIGIPYPVVASYHVGVNSSAPLNPTPDSAGRQLQMTTVGNIPPEANRKPKGPQYLDPEAIPWIPGSTPFTSNMPISVIKKARSPDFYLLQGLEYASQRASEEEKREKPEKKSPKVPDVVNGCRKISAAEYAGLLVQNMTEETNPLLTKYLNPGKTRSHDPRRHASMPDSWRSQRRQSEEIGSRRRSWSHLGRLGTSSRD